MTLKRWGKPACAIAVVFFSLWFRLDYQANTVVDVPLRADAGQYYNIGWNILNHGVVSMAYPSDTPPEPDSYRGPGYPLLVALAIYWGGDEKGYTYVLILQAVLGALSVALTMALARQWMSFSYAILAGMLVAVWPHLVSLSGFVLTETSFGFFLLLGTYLLSHAVRTQRRYLYMLSGFAFGYSALINPAILFFTPIAAVALALLKRKHLVIFLCCSLIIPAAWSLRGATLEAEKSSSGRLVENILAGSEPDFSYDFSAMTQDAVDRVRTGTKRYENDVLAALASIGHRFEDDPAFYLNWYLLRKPARFWQWTILGDSDIYVYPVKQSPFQTEAFHLIIISICTGLNTILMAAAFTLVPVFAIRGFRHKLPEQEIPLVLVMLIFVYATLLHTVLLPDPRYATPYRSFEILLGLTLLYWIHSFIREHRQVDSKEPGQGSTEIIR